MDASGLFVTDDTHSDDDNISINSTLASDHDSDEEWSVQGIRAQSREGGRDKFLVEWTDYPIEEATWEPEENVTDELLGEWRDTQAKQARGEESPFNIAAWQESVAKRNEAKYQRHHKRNIERKQRGIQLRLWEGETKADYYLSDEDVGVDDYNALFPPPKVVGREDDVVHHDTQPPVPPESSPKQTVAENPNPQKRSSVAEKPKSTTEKTNFVSIPQPRSQPSLEQAAANGSQGTGKKKSLAIKLVNNATTSRQPSSDTATARIAHKAKKTATSSRTMVRSQHSGTGINVFAAGKQSKQRRQLVQNVVDPTKDARLFSNHRLRRKVELQGRDRADVAPTVPTKLFSISRGPPPGTNIGSNISPTTSNPRSALRRSTDDFTTRSASESSVTASERMDLTRPPTLEQSHTTQPMVRKRKSVQFVDLPLVDEPEDMEMDDQIVPPKRLKSPPMPPDLSQSSQPPAKPQSILRKLSITDYKSRSTGQNYDKAVILGPSGSKDIEMIFDNVTTDSDAWHMRFVNEKMLHFARNFTAKSFASQRTGVVERVLSNGSVRPKSATDQGAVERAAEQLRSGSFGVACFYEEFLIIIYPAQCEDWKQIMHEAEANSPANVALRYIIFKPQPAAKPLPARQVDTVDNPKITPRVAVFRDLLRLDYQKILPPGIRDVRHNFYLAFPPSRVFLLEAVSEWLRSENPKCRVFSTKTNGDWAAFTNPKIVAQGVIIVHETAADALRRFPGLLKLLLHKSSATYVFWCIGESLQLSPAYPSIRSIHDQSEPGTFELTRFFPHGNAILVTPSFLVSEPHRALRLFEWYKNTYKKSANNQKIVAAASIREYMRDLAYERSAHRDELMTEGNRTRKWSMSDREEIARKAGLSREDCAARFETCAIVEGLQPSVEMSIVPDEQLEPIVFADGSIDANDEQSLVNWFGCWSQTRLDQFRKFHVLGTDGSSDNSHLIKDSDIPIYPPGVGRDTGAEPNLNVHGPDQIMSGSDHDVQPQSGVSKLLGGLSAFHFTGKLMAIGKQNERPNLCPFGKLFGYPVSYYEDVVNTADSYGDFHRDFKTFDKWMKFPWPFFSTYQPFFKPPGGIHVPPTFNTYFAFFYTPEEDSPIKPPPRHPWLAIWRVREPHKPWEGTELFIWDVTAKGRYSTANEIYECQLLQAQQHLIQMVRERSEDVQRGLPLQQVWFGGFETEPSDYTLPVDITIFNLDVMMSNTKKHLPVQDRFLLRRGYRKIFPGEAPARQGSHLADSMNVDLMGGHRSHGGESKIIFHPPRASNPNGQSRCENLFFTWVMNIDRKKRRSAYAYTFKPTIEWYQEQQVAENRHFEHINVASWQRVFELVRIPPERRDKAEPRGNGEK
ncbi:chromo domain-containing protein [Colletotrichum orchidophilum]|uniref:Chromo domain-containing protein n=1 Tax=Colletotrichum orchidophilum TaxID=1209926 RepID=A0A1G4B4A7_9PEZI|nr:chromo domain-containing protein [Colletotrichum orchidophilum]OHE96153.1 chromo domain-containing protein [Colletotrichum orchidophilum]